MKLHLKTENTDRDGYQVLVSGLGKDEKDKKGAFKDSRSPFTWAKVCAYTHSSLLNIPNLIYSTPIETNTDIVLDEHSLHITL